MKKIFILKQSNKAVCSQYKLKLELAKTKHINLGYKILKKFWVCDDLELIKSSENLKIF